MFDSARVEFQPVCEIPEEFTQTQYAIGRLHDKATKDEKVNCEGPRPSTPSTNGEEELWSDSNVWFSAMNLSLLFFF